MIFTFLFVSLVSAAATCTATATTRASASRCVFCTGARTYDLGSVSNQTFLGNGTGGVFHITTPCGSIDSGACLNEPTTDPAAQGCRGLGSLSVTPTVLPLRDIGVNITLFGGSNNPPCRHNPDGNRTLIYQFICDNDVPHSNPPETEVIENPGCTYVVTWKHPSVCGGEPTPPNACTTPAPPAPPPIVCDVCLPKWNPTWDMWRSTMLYTCNDTGMHSVDEAVKYGLVVYDWSNAKQLWANAHPMNSEELLTKQAESVMAVDPGIAGEQPRVWVYRNTIKALNWYSSVREKLDDPEYSGWFVKFKDYKGEQSNNSYHVPACTWYNHPTTKCSGFYHDEAQTPQHPGGGKAYRVDGSCDEQCDCGPTNPCAEYTFDHRNASFANWFINDYMISNETLLHTPLPIGLGYLDDSMTLQGMTEGAPYPTWVEDTGSSEQDMIDHVTAYHTNIQMLAKKVVAMGGYYYQLIKNHGPLVRPTPVHAHGKRPAHNVTTKQCIAALITYCVPNPEAWKMSALYEAFPTESMDDLGQQATSEFLLTRGPYAWLGYGWVGCSSVERPRPTEWDADYGGEPSAACSQTSQTSGVFTRDYPKATVQWDCNTGKGSITTK